MPSVNNAITVSETVRARQMLQASLIKLMDAQDYLAQHLAMLDGVERQVRVLALREGTRLLDDDADRDALRDLGTLQAETNAHFREMRETYTRLSAQIAALMASHESLYNATFAQGGGAS